MEINRELLEKIAHLSRLELNEQDINKLTEDLTTITNWVEKLREVDTTGIEPLTTMSHEINSLREDTITEHLPHDLVLQNAPSKTDGFFVVPKLLD